MGYDLTHNMKAVFCCKGCEERVVGCHSTCERYITAKNTYEKEKSQFREERLKKKDVADYKMQLIIKKAERRRCK